MRVLHLLAPARVGGLERVVRTLAQGLSGQGVGVVVAEIVGTSGGSTPASFGDGTGGGRVISIPVENRGYLAERRAVGRVLRAMKPDILHTHGYRPDVLDSPLARALGVPTVTTVHGFTGGGPRNRLYEWLQKRSFRDFDAVVAVAGSIVEILHKAGVDPERIHLVRNAWHSDFEILPPELARSALGLEREDVVIGWVGRLTPEKGPDITLRAVHRLEHPGVRLCVVGSGPLESGLRKLADELGIGDRVAWAREVPDAYRLFSAFDVLALSSWTEGTPMVLLEAMAAQVPIVATAVGGVPDMLSASEAVLVPPGDPGALGDAIRRVLGDPGGARARAARAKSRLAKEFGLERWVQRYLGIYESLVSRPSALPQP